MKPTINYLKNEYGNELHTKIANWVNIQYARSGFLHGQKISLRDCNEIDVLKTVERVKESVSLPFIYLLDGVAIAPRLNSTMSDFEVVAKISAGAFNHAFINAGFVIDDIVFAKQGDEVEYSGTQKHTAYKLHNDDENAGISCAFMNFSIPSANVKGSVLLNAEEVAAERNSCVLNMFHGLDVFDQQEWEQNCAALLFKRLISESTFMAICKSIDPSHLTFIQDLIALSEEPYSKVVDGQDNRVLNNYGKVIARKTFRFSALDRKITKDSMYSNNVTPISPGKQLDVTPDSFESRTTLNGFSNF